MQHSNPTHPDFTRGWCGLSFPLLLLLLLQGYGIGLPGQFSGQQGSEGYMQDGQEEEDDAAKAEADAEGALWLHDLGL
jgi:hypothetical protein